MSDRNVMKKTQILDLRKKQYVELVTVSSCIRVSKVVADHGDLLTQSRYINKWVNSGKIFFWYKLLQTTSGPQQFAKIRVFKVDNFVLLLILAPKLRSVAQIELKNTHLFIFSTFGSELNVFKRKKLETNEKISKISNLQASTQTSNSH